MVTVERTSSQIMVGSPFSPDLPPRARKISGNWNSYAKVWQFPIEAEEQVKDLYLDVYGEWPDMPVDTVNLLCVAGKGRCDTGVRAEKSSLTLGGRVIATASGRDSGARTAPGVIVIDGDGFGSAGSVKNWATCVAAGTKFRLLNVPRLKAEQLVENPEWCESIEIEERKEIDKEKLAAERERLVARISEIDKILEDGLEYAAHGDRLCKI